MWENRAAFPSTHGCSRACFTVSRLWGSSTMSLLTYRQHQTNITNSEWAINKERESSDDWIIKWASESAVDIWMEIMFALISFEIICSALTSSALQTGQYWYVSTQYSPDPLRWETLHPTRGRQTRNRSSECDCTCTDPPLDRKMVQSHTAWGRRKKEQRQIAEKMQFIISTMKWRGNNKMPGKKQCDTNFNKNKYKLIK